METPIIPPDVPDFEERPYGWVIVAVATLCLAMGFGVNVTVSVFIKPFEQEFGWARADISMAYTFLTIGAAAGGIFWGSLSDRFPVRAIAVFGTIAIAAPLMLLGMQSTLWGVYAIYFVIGGFGFACLFTPMLALTGLWFNKRKGLALGIVTAGGAIGQGVVPYLARFLVTEFGWRETAFYLGASYLAILLPLLFLVKPPPVKTALTANTTPSNGNLWGLPHEITIPWLAIAGVFCCICMAVPIVHVLPLGTDLGLSPQTAAAVLLALMVSGVFGRLFFGWLADRIGGLYAYFAASLAQTATVFWFVQTGDLALLYLIAVVFGFGYAGVMTGLIICAREASPLRITGLGIAIVTTTAWLGMGIGGWQGGYFYDLTGNYAVSYGNAALSGAINLVIVASLIWYRRTRLGAPAPA